MATKQEREKVARELHETKRIWRCNVEGVGGHTWNEIDAAAKRPWLSVADAAIALRDKALKDAAERVRGLKPECPSSWDMPSWEEAMCAAAREVERV